MNATSCQRTERDEQRVHANRRELTERIAGAVPRDGTATPLEGILLRRASAPTQLGHGVSSPTFCVIAQGRKELRLGEAVYWYDPAHYLVATAELPITTRIAEASPEHPYLGLVLALDPVLVGSVVVETGHSTPRGQSTMRAVAVSSLDADLLDAVVRLIRLLDTPTEARFLAPLITREIVFRLVMGEQGGRVRHIATLGGYTHRIARAIDRLRKDFDRQVRIEDMAHELGMSVSSFHAHFKEVTAMSPLEFQKQLRLQEARRLMLGEALDAASAGYRVGYNDASHFSRDYKRMFGSPPMRDVEQLRGMVMESVNA